MKLRIIHQKVSSPKNALTGFALIMLCLLFIACGGSGDSGSSSGGSSYSGSTDRAVITSENSGTLINESFQGAMTSDSMMPFASLTPESQQSAKGSGPLGLQSAFSTSLAQAVDASGGVISGQRATTSSATSTINGDCGGTATYTISADQSTGVFSGRFSYSGFCNGGITLSGSATFTGRYDSAAKTFDYFTFTFSNLTTTAEGQTSSISGSLECDFTGTDIVITADLVVASSGQICWLNDYTIQIIGNEMEISGRFYHPVYGYIDFSTVEPLIIAAGSQYPTAGLIVFTGGTGAGGLPTQARLRAISATYCQVTADFDGDGIFEYDSGEILWTDL